MCKIARSRAAAWLSICAMVLQVLFGAAHAASMAATAFGAVSLDQAPSGSFGLLQICTANGLIEIRPGGENGQPRQENTVKDLCPVCGSASVSPAIAALGADVPAVPFTPVVIPLIPEQCAVITQPSRQHLIRGPPIAQII